jgi:O-acetyl-ADP-ribose deacetylase (regulator of RNase III)
MNADACHWMLKLKIMEGDVTKQKVDAIVNAANTSLLGGGGVDGAIHRAAGPQLLEECRALGGCPTGEARITNGYNLPAKYVIHTVGPIWAGGGKGEADLLARCYRSCFALAAEYDLRSIAFPSISTGAYGYPLEQAARIALTEMRRFLETEPPLERLLVVCYPTTVYEAYHDALQEMVPE